MIIENTPSAERPVVTATASRWFFGGFAVLLLLLGQPLTLLFPTVDFDAQWIRFFLSGTGLVLLVGGIGLWYKTEFRPAALLCVIVGSLLTPFYFYPPGLHGHAFSFQLPVLLLLLIPANLMLATHRFSTSRGRRWILLGFLLLVSLQLVLHPDLTAIQKTVPYYAYPAVPLATIVWMKTVRPKTMHIAMVFASIWLLSVVYAALQIFSSQNQLTGISGNQNWFACALLATVPWAVIVLQQALQSAQPRLTGHVRTAIAWGVVLLPSIYLLLACNSRAVHLALASYGLLLCTYKLPRRLRLIFVGLLLIAGLVLFLSLQSHFQRLSRVDVRLPLWKSAISLIQENPVMGVGPGHLPEVLPEKLAESGYFDRYVAGTIAEHTHNELLQFTVLLGIPAILLWLALVLPCVFGNPYGWDRVFRAALFTLFICLAMGMFDKALSRPPGNLLWLLALGLCWSRVWKTKVGIQTGGLKYRLFFSGAAAILLLVLAIPITGSRWFYRRGRQLLAFQQYAQAHAAHHQALKWQPKSIRNAYAAAVIAVQHLNQPQHAASDLQRVFDLNPRYAHINRLLGRHCYQLRQFSLAADYFRAELQLFPRDPLSWQWYYLSLAQADKTRQLPAIDELLTHLYVRRVQNYAELNGLAGFGQIPAKAILAGDWPTAIQSANRLAAVVPSHSATDPQAPWMQTSSWPTEFLARRFGVHDVLFWRDIQLRHELAANKSMKSIFQTVCDRIEIVPAAAWTPPADTWARKQGSPAAVYQLLSWLLPQSNVIYHGDGAEAWFVLVIGPRQVWRLHLAAQTIEPVTAKALPADFADSAELFVMPHEFTCRHQILGAVTQAESAVPYPTNTPTTQCLQLSALAEKHGIKLKWSTLISSDTMEQFRSRLSEGPDLP